MKIPGAALFAAVFLCLSLSSAGAIETPDVTFIPGQISVNSSFILIADPHASPTESVGVKWIVFGVDNAYGSIPKSGSRYVCYFSNTDPENTCGPNMFPAPSGSVPYELQVNATNQYSQTRSVLLGVGVGGIPIRTDIKTAGNEVYVSAWAGNPIDGTITYKVYASSTLDIIKSGSMTYNPNIYGYTANITLTNGEYYLAFTANSSSDFGGGVSRVVVGGGSSGSPAVRVDNITYSPVINPGQEYRLEVFRITNTGADNLTGLSISVPQQISSYLSITPKETFLQPNESTYMTVLLRNIQSSTNISAFATLFSGSTELKQIPVELRVSVIGQVNPASCSGKPDKALCLGGICCGEVCRTGGAECCASADCPSGQSCSGSFRCTASVTPGECEGKNDSASCSAGVCCRGSCVECCANSDCGYQEVCNYYNKCEEETNPIDECEGKTDGTSCSDGVCCSGSCVQCCTNDHCPLGQVCSSSNFCSEPAAPQGPDILTIALIGGGVAAAAVVGFFLYKKFRKKGDEGEEEFEEGGKGEGDEFSDEDFY